MQSKNIIITQIKTKPNTSQCFISINNLDILECSFDLVLKHNLQKGMVLTDELLAEIKKEQKIFEIKRTALNFASFKPRTTQQIKNKLRLKGFNQEEISFAIDFLREFKMLDDEKYAQDFVRSYLNRKSVGKSKLIAELRKRGISENIAESAVDIHFAPESEYSLAIRAVEKKLKSLKNKPPDKQLNSLISYLQRNGFRWETIKKVIEEILPIQNDF